MVCQKGEKATVTYKFSGGTERTYTTENTPIEISTREGVLENFEGGQCPVQYGLYINTETSARLTTNGAVSAYGKLVKNDQFNQCCRYVYIVGNGVYSDTRVICSNFPCSDTNQPPQMVIEPYVKRIDNSLDNCGNPEKQCEILVTHQGNTIFSDRGKCPVTYSVSCGDCPEGTLKCSKSGYPGFCCVPCNEIATGIKAITTHVRSVNNG